jgi:endogenous inhibitor of DNA gyrase (YacG/DUF329 family)
VELPRELGFGDCGYNPMEGRAMADADRFDRERLKCSRCATEMEEMARIAPFGGNPGLRVFECPTCGAEIARLDEYRHAPHKSDLQET